MTRDLSQLFCNGPKSKPFEVVLAKRGPFSGRRLKLATDNAFDAFAFVERNKEVAKKPETATV